MYPPSLGELESFQKAADYNLARKTRGRGLGSIFWGILNLLVGWVFFSNDIFTWGVLLLGISLIAEGSWIFFKPSAKGFLIDGVFLSLIGVWNIVVTVNDYYIWSQLIGRYYYVSSPSPAFIMIGVMQIVWSVYSIKRYMRFSKVPNEKPDPNISIRVNELMDSIKKARTYESLDLIEFLGANTNWKGRLIGDVAALVGVSGLLRKSVDDAAFVPRKDFQVTDEGRYRLSKFRRVNVKMGSRVINGVMKPESLQRYQQVWQAPSATYPPPPPPP
jgi:hypothetical protein